MSMVFDVIVSLGEACSCSSSLRVSRLQFISYPLDWLFGSDFKGRVNIFASGFKRFCDECDLEYVYSERSILCDAYHNKYNDLTFNHDFPTGVALSESWRSVNAKYNRRISRVLHDVEKANSVLFVYIETPNSESVASNDEIITAFSKLKTRYPKKHIELLYFHNDLLHCSKKYTVEQLPEGITKVITNYKSMRLNTEPWTVSLKVLKKFLRKYRLNRPFKFWFFYYLKLFAITIIPIKRFRRNLKKKYHVWE